jgi:hypothetical protein
VAALFALAGLSAALGVSNAGHVPGRVPVAATASCQDRASPPPALGAH